MFEREDRGSIAVLRMAHGKASAMDIEFLRGLTAQIGQIDASDARALVVTGTGSIFSAGVDLVRLTREGRPYVRAFLPALDQALVGLLSLPMPLIAAINGHAIAGGAIVAWACDRRVMSRGRGRIGAPELLVGVPFPFTPLEIVRAALAPHEAQAAALTGVTRDPEDALAHGFVDELTDEGGALERGIAIAEQWAAMPVAAFRLTKAALRAPMLERIRQHAAAHDRAVTDAWASDEVLNAVGAYVEKTLRR